MRIGWNATAVIADQYRIVGLKFQFNPVSMAGNRFVHRVIKDFSHEMMKCGVVGAPNIHTRAATDWLQSFENLDILG